MYTTLIDVAALEELTKGGSDLLICDCRFELTDAQAGTRAYAAGHIPGAVHVDLDRDMCGAKSGTNGRHPLPDRARFAARMAELGAGDGTQIVAYDAFGGMYAARLWWSLRWAGHAAAAVLDGGWQAWTGKGFSQSTEMPRPRAGAFSLRPSLVATVDYDAVLENVGSGRRIVIDARSADRFRGENETLDPVGGHIPGARNRFFRDNLDADGRFKPAEALRSELRAVAGDADPASLIAQCGSGVTACHNLLALEVAGLKGAALYPGSWSEWCSRLGAPVAQGPE